MYQLIRHEMKGAGVSSPGFTLIELMVVMVIAAILAIGAVLMYSDPTSKVKGAAFNILTDFNFARSESVNRNEDVLIDFTLGDKDGYLICRDTNADKDCNDEIAEDVIKEVLFREEVQFYDCTSAPPFPEGGPSKTPSGTTLAGKKGLIFGGPEYIKLQPDGTSSDNGSIIIYHPAHQNPQKVKGNAYAAVISSASTGRIRLMRYYKGKGWFKK
jgi:prepilin-type N-terminal cleavage/methylation domain-containing protein